MQINLHYYLNVFFLQKRHNAFALHWRYKMHIVDNIAAEFAACKG